MEYVPQNRILPGGQSPEGIRCNTIVKRYPDGSAVIMASDRRIFRIPGFEASGDTRTAEKPVSGPTDPETAYATLERRAVLGDGGPTPCERMRADANRARARRRAAAAVRDLAYANPFKYFVTLTFDKAKVDRWDDAEVMRVTKNWLDNMVRREGLAYVLVPERHKDGAIHFHGFFNDAVSGVDSGHKTQSGQTIFNLPRWPWGFTTAMEVYGDYSAAVGYVCKYISKGEDKVGGRWYWHGGKLAKPDVEYINTDWEQVSQGCDTVTIDALGAEMVRIRAEKGGCE